MKCDKLKPLIFSLNDLAYIDEAAAKKNFDNPHDHAVYKATEVDAAIAELKAENKLLKEHIANGDVSRITWIDEVIELKQKLEDAQREVNNYRRHANECEGLAAKGNIDKVSLLEEIKDLKNDKELLDSQLYGFLQLEEECGGGDLRNYILRLKQKLENVQASMYADVVDANMENRRLKRALWRAIALFCARSCEYFNGIMSHCLIGQDDLYKLCEKKKNKYLHAVYKCREKMEEYK